MKRKRLVQSIVAAVVFLGVVVARASEPPAGFPDPHISIEEWKVYRLEVLAIPDVTCEPKSRELYCLSNSRSAAWVFTEEGNPAHPAVATVVLSADGKVGAGMLFRGFYAGDEAAFLAWAVKSIGERPIFGKWMQAALGGGT
jgi:hypothetical protein